MNRFVVILTLCVVATGLGARTPQTGRAASNAESMKEFHRAEQEAVRQHAIATASCDEEAHVFHWRLTMPPDLGSTLSTGRSR